ncbi:MAG: phosphotransferase family protein [Deltaproteobacteria bacterium]|nr:MAG: phosphotransferase family protein [Deltaproteobacteria bacterium]
MTRPADESPALDRPAPVRAGEELDLTRLAPWVRDALGSPAAQVTVAQFPGGHSNLTYWVRVGDDEYVLRRPPFGANVKSAHDMRREYRILSNLSRHYPRAPEPVAFCDDPAVLGCEFYLMRRVRGAIIRRTPPPGIDLSPPVAADLCEAFVDTLAELHSLEPDAIGLGDFGRPDGYVQRQIEGWTRRYHGARTDDVPAVDRVARWLADHMPASLPGRIIHNDYKFDNLVVDPAEPTRIVGILDWEMATVGDPLMDLGTALAYWVEAADPAPLRAVAFGPTALPGMFTRQQLVDAYARRTGRDVAHVVFYYAYGLFKTAVIVQQIYYRYVRGFTRDERFARLGDVTRLLVDAAAAAIDRGAITIAA